MILLELILIILEIILVIIKIKNNKKDKPPFVRIFL